MGKEIAKIQHLKFDNAAFIPIVIDILNEGKTATIALKGWSMRPFLEHERDKGVLSKPLKPFCVGDVVLAETYPKHYVLHRIVSINGENVTLLGDGNLLPEYCKIKDIKAFAVGFYRKGRNTLDATNGKKFRIYSKIWMKLTPIRRYLLFAYRIWIKLFGAI